MIRSLALAAACALAVSGCGSGDGDDAGSGASVAVTERATGDYAYVEGYHSFVELMRDGTAIAAAELSDRTASLEVAPGVYHLRFYLRPCSGNCDNLDAPTGECIRRLDLSRAGQYAVVVRHSLGPDGRCEVEAEGRPANGESGRREAEHSWVI